MQINVKCHNKQLGCVQILYQKNHFESSGVMSWMECQRLKATRGEDVMSTQCNLPDSVDTLSPIKNPPTRSLRVKRS